MSDPRSPAALPRRIPWLIGLAVGALSLAIAWVAGGTMPSGLPDPAPMAEAERLALTMLAVVVAALAILAGIAAFALESSLEPPVAPRRPLPATPARRPQVVTLREAA